MHTLRYEQPPDGYRFTPPAGPPVPRPMPPPVPAQRVRTGIVTLAVLASLFLVSAGTFVTLFLIAGGDHKNAVTRLDDQRDELSDVTGRVVSAEGERGRAEDRNTALKSDNTDLSGCVEAMRHYLWDGLASTQRTAAVRDILTKCR